MDNNAEILKFANDTVANVEGLLNAITKNLSGLESQLKSNPEMVAKLANEMKLAETSERICALKKELKNMKV